MKNIHLRVLPVLAMASIFAASNAGVLYTQAYDGTGNLFASQNDPGGDGNFATTYDNFTLAGGGTVNEVQWTGGYFNPPNQAPISQWTVNFYADAGGVPGGLLDSTVIGGTGNETSLGGAIYTYDVAVNPFGATAGTQYWLSVEPNMAFPPQWGWATGTGGDGAAYQVFFGAGGATGNDQAFTLLGPSGTPEPFTMSIGLAGAALAFRRRMKSKKA